MASGRECGLTVLLATNDCFNRPTSLIDAVSNLALRWRDDLPVVSVVAFAHLISHFFQLILAPLFPWLKAEFALSYAELGFIMSVLFTVSALGQAAAGFVVDRFGALKTLNAGLLCLSIGAALISVSSNYMMLLAGSIFVGLGNAVFHPVDFWLINHKVNEKHLGPAYSVHGLTGSLGWAAAPVFLVGLALPFGWRTAAAAAAVLPLLAIALACYHAAALGGPDDPVETTAGEQAVVAPLAFLRSRSLWLCFFFFAFVAAALGGVQSFSPTIFDRAYGLSTSTAALSVTIYMLASGTGMLAGGWLVAKSAALERNITIALSLSVLAAVLIGLNLLPAAIAFSLMAVMGFGSGLSGPSRDMLIRSATPPGSTGRVYGVVYSGLDLGIAVGPVLFGRMLDRGLVAEVYFAVAACLFFSVLVAWRVHSDARLVAAGSA